MTDDVLTEAQVLLLTRLINRQLPEISEREEAADLDIICALGYIVAPYGRIILTEKGRTLFNQLPK